MNKLKLILLIATVFLWTGTGLCAGDITGNPRLGKTTGWRLLEEEPTEDDYSIDPDTASSSALYNSGVFPIDFTKTNTTTLTLSFVPFIVGDKAYEDDGSIGTITGVNYTAKTITMSTSDVSGFQTSGQLAPFAVVEGAVDMGAKEFPGFPNNAPVTGVITITGDTGTPAGSQVTIDGDVAVTSDPSDPDGDPITHCWDFDGDGDCEATTQNVAAYTISGLVAGQTFTARYQATDSGGRQSLWGSATITVAGEPEEEVEVTKVFGRNAGNDFNTGDDTRIEQANPSTNNDTDNYLTTKIATGENWYTLLSWSLAGLPNDAVATSAKIRMRKYLGPGSGTRVVTAMVTTDPFVTAEAIYTKYDSTHNWSANFGRTTTLGSVSVTYNDKVAAIHEIDFGENLDELNDAIAADGTFRCFLSMDASYYNFYSNDSTAGEYGPELHITYNTESEPEVPECSFVWLEPASGTTLGIGGVVRGKLSCNADITHVLTGGADPLRRGTDIGGLSLAIESANGHTAREHTFSGVVEAGDNSASLTLSANILRSDDNLKYGGSGGTNIAYDFASLDTGVIIDTTPPAEVTTTEVCDEDGEHVEADVQVTSVSPVYFALNFPEGAWQAGGNIFELPIEIDLDYGSLVLLYCSDQPSGWGVGQDDWLYYGTPTPGARGEAVFPEEITHSGNAKIIDGSSSHNELLDYGLAPVYTWVFAIPANIGGFGAKGEFATIQAAETAFGHFVAGDTIALVKQDTYTETLDDIDNVTIDFNRAVVTLTINANCSNLTLLRAGRGSSITDSGSGTTIGNFVAPNETVEKGFPNIIHPSH